MKIFVKEQLSPHKYKTPQGYLICTDAILARTGKQTYMRRDFFPDAADPTANLEVDRPEKEVFSDAAIASFENMPVTVEHPYSEVTSENWKDNAVGYVRDVHQGEYDGEKVLLGTLVIQDATTIENIENGKHTELSCGYDCDVDDMSNPVQRNIRGNHIALCEKGRAGIAHIRDSVKDVEPKEGESKEDFISRFMSETKEEYPDEKQRVAVAHSYWEKKHGKDSVKDTARTITVQCYIFSRDGKQILTQDRPGPSWPGLAVPGGHVKADETPLEACVREVREETGLEVRQLRLFGTHQYECEEDGPSIAMLYTTTDSYGDLIVESDEGYHRWYSLEEVLKSPKCAEGFQSILSKCINGDGVFDSVKDVKMPHSRGEFYEYHAKNNEEILVQCLNDNSFLVYTQKSGSFKIDKQGLEKYLNMMSAQVKDSVKDGKLFILKEKRTGKYLCKGDAHQPVYLSNSSAYVKTYEDVNNAKNDVEKYLASNLDRFELIDFGYQRHDSVKDADTKTNLINALNSLKIGFRLIKEGKTWTDRKHFEFETGKVENFRQTMELIDKVIDRFDDAYHCSSTYNAVLKSDGTINIVIDVDDKYAHDSLKSVMKAQKIAKIAKIVSLSKK